MILVGNAVPLIFMQQTKNENPPCCNRLAGKDHYGGEQRHTRLRGAGSGPLLVNGGVVKVVDTWCSAYTKSPADVTVNVRSNRVPGHGNPTSEATATTDRVTGPKLGLGSPPDERIREKQTEQYKDGDGFKGAKFCPKPRYEMASPGWRTVSRACFFNDKK